MIKELSTDILVVGAGLGGIAAALSALRLGKRVILTEETDWIGGQMTAQGVPPDEHNWIEETGCTETYRQLRNGIRDYYRRHYPLVEDAHNDPKLNPGRGNVSRICHEPRVGLAVLEAMLAPYRSSSQLRVLPWHRPVAAECDGDKVRAVRARDSQTGDDVILHAPYILDATELGDLLDLARVEHVIGAESQSQTGELHALPGEANPLDQQAVTWCFALDYLPGEDHTIERPADYDFWRSYRASFWPGPQLGWEDVNPITLEKRRRSIFDGDPTRESSFDFWHYRRILYEKNFAPGAFRSGITMVNWPQIDYWLKPLIGVEESVTCAALHEARQLSLSWLYWMQTEAPRHDAGYGYRGLRLRGDALGDTAHGLAKSAYVREARRIVAESIVTEQHVGVEQRAGLVGAERFHDTVGVGSYRIDLHPSTALRTYVDVDSWPFEVPLGALLPVRVENLLPACKNLGVTHITNGCYRLHPVEWNIGEAAGALAAHCLEKDLTPRQVRNTPALLEEFQSVLSARLGLQLRWEESIRSTPAQVQ